MLAFVTITLLAVSLSLSSAAENESIVAVPPRNQSTRHSSPLFESKIVGGRPANQHEFPWQASVLSCNKAGSCSVCGGSLISKNYVLTAAHCVYGLKDFDIGLGSNKLFEVKTKSSSVTIHNKYNPKTLENDVAVIKLQTEQKLSKTIQTIELPSRNIGSLDGKVVTVSGYGKTSDSSSVSQTLNTVNLKVISISQCRRYYGSQVKDTTLCAVGSTNSRQSTCQGDSGGPLVLKSGSKHIQVGVVSFVSNQGCAKGHPSGYARVSSFLPWISRVTGITTK